MWDDDNYKVKRYRCILKSLYLAVSCFTLLYFFVFTESYSDERGFGRPNQPSESGLLTELLPGADDQSFELIKEALVMPVSEKQNQLEEKGKSSLKQGEKRRLLPCGIPVGIYLETKGVLVTEVTHVTGSDGKQKIPCDGLIEAGDYILQADRKKVTSKEEFRDMVRSSRGSSMKLTVEHNGRQKMVTIKPVLADSQEYIAGLWIRDNMHGIGTLTWLDEKGSFAALGHCISDIDTGGLMEIDHGQLYHAEIYSLVKGSESQPGSLAGAIDYRMKSCVGTVTDNTEQGIFGSGNKRIQNLVLERLNSYYKTASFSALWEQAALETAAADEIRDGKAQMLSCFSGEYRLYDLEIRKIAGSEAGYENINLEITVTDSSLLKQTGGILQGMSGSPIIQNGKIIGAVTHVLVNNQTKGYGIFIENMLAH